MCGGFEYGSFSRAQNRQGIDFSEFGAANSEDTSAAIPVIILSDRRRCRNGRPALHLTAMRSQCGSAFKRSSDRTDLEVGFRPKSDLVPSSYRDPGNVVSSTMAFRSISLVALCLMLSSCSDGGFNGRTQQFSGVWLDEFEGSTFVEGASEVPKERPAPEKTDWFEWRDQPRLEELVSQAPEIRDCHAVLPIQVTFVGQRTHYLFGGAGHMRLWRSKMTVERTISARRLGPPFCYAR